MKCGYCHSEFEAKRATAVFCSAKCRVYANREGLHCKPQRTEQATPSASQSRQCEYCNANFDTSVTTRRFCSDKCRVYAHRKQTVTAKRNSEPELKTPVEQAPVTAKGNTKPRGKAKPVTAKRNSPAYLYWSKKEYGDDYRTKWVVAHRWEVHAYRSGPKKGKHFVYGFVYETAVVPDLPMASTLEALQWSQTGTKSKRDTRAEVARSSDTWKAVKVWKTFNHSGEFMTDRQLRNRWEREAKERAEEAARQRAEEERQRAEEEARARDWDEWLERLEALGKPRREALATLGLSPGASMVDIKRRYRELAAKHHPDRGGDPTEFRKVQEAFELCNG